MPKEGSHFDLPIAVALLCALGMIPQEEIGACVLMGELALGGDLVQVAGCLPAVLHHLTGQNLIAPAQPGEVTSGQFAKDLSDVKGQERAKRALEIAGAGRHHMLMVGPPGSGKSMMAARLPGLLPPLSPAEALETSMIHSLAGLLDEGGSLASGRFTNPTAPPPWLPLSAEVTTQNRERFPWRTMRSCLWTSFLNFPTTF